MYIVRTDDDRRWKRHIDQLRPKIVKDEIPATNNNHQIQSNIGVADSDNQHVHVNITNLLNNRSKTEVFDPNRDNVETVNSDTSRQNTSDTLISELNTYDSKKVLRRSSRTCKPRKILDL